MQLRNPPLFLWLAAGLSLAAMHVAAWYGAKLGFIAAAAGFAIAAGIAAARLTVNIKALPRKTAAAQAVVDSTRISALAYGWGAAALISLYRFTPLHWQHGWQYGSAMLLICIGLVAYITLFERENSPLTQRPALDRIVALAAAQGLAVAGAVVWLLLSGKLSSPKGDWAANAIFLTGGIAISWISYLAVTTHRDLKRIALREELAG